MDSQSVVVTSVTSVDTVATATVDRALSTMQASGLRRREGLISLISLIVYNNHYRLLTALSQ